MPDVSIQCIKCELFHLFDERVEVYDDGMTTYVCPQCGEESYYKTKKI